MARALVVSLGLHGSLALGAVFGLPSIPIDFSAPDTFDVEMQIVDVEDDAALFDLAALSNDEVVPDLPPLPEGAPAVEIPNIEPEPEPQPVPEQLSQTESPPEMDLADALRELQQLEPEVDIPQLDASQATESDKQLDVAQQDTLEVEVENARILDLEAEASLGNGGEQSTQNTESDEELSELEPGTDAEALSQADLEAQTVDGGDADALLEQMAALQESNDQFPPADPNTAEAVEEEFNPDVAVEEAPTPGEEGAPEELETAEADPNAPVNVEADSAFANLPLPKVRPTRRVEYVDPDSPDDQAKIVSAARRVFEEPEPEPDPEQEAPANADDILNALAEAPESGAGTGAQGEGQGNDPEAEVASAAAEVARSAANETAMASINQRIQPDWPAFARGQFGWVVQVRVALADLEGFFVQLETKVLKAPSQATALQIQTMEQAVKSAVAASQPWPIPEDYAEDWFNIIEFEICPQMSVLSSSRGCS